MHQYKGKLILHTGSMFSGKTSSLWKDLNRFQIAKYNVSAFKPAIDVRYSKNMIISHDNNQMQCMAVRSISDIVKFAKNHPVDVIGIDEVQFMGDSPKEILDAINDLLNDNKTLVIAGLDMDFQAKPFEIVKELMPVADYLTKHHAVCAGCGVDAWVSHRKTETLDRVVIGAQQEYEPLCRKCYFEKEAQREASKNQMTLPEFGKAIEG